jgi:pimeloyl-ACP methyl ester carboxylesterase
VLPEGDRDAPLVIYHHGAAEGGYLFSFKGLFRRKSFTDSGMNLMAVKAPWCRNNKQFFSCISSLSRYTAMLASSAALIEMIIREHRTISSGPVIVTGMSLGGVVSCLHAALYGSADRYIPILAGPLVGDLFIDSGYAVMTSPEARRTRERHIREVLNFGDEYRAANPNHVYPILGRYDRIFPLAKQLPFFDASNYTIIDKGHSTGASSLAMLSSLLYDRIISEG